MRILKKEGAGNPVMWEGSEEDTDGKRSKRGVQGEIEVMGCRVNYCVRPTKVA